MNLQPNPGLQQGIDSLPDFRDFGDTSLARWRDLATAALKGGKLARLQSRSAEGLAIAPLYSRPVVPPVAPLLPATPGWVLAQRLDMPDSDAAQAQALHDLEGGAEALTLVTAGAVGAYGFGLKGTRPEDFAAALQGVEADLITLRLDAQGSGLAASRALMAGLAAKGFQIASLHIDFCCNPIGAVMRGEPDAMADMAGICALARSLSEAPSRSRAAAADGRIAHAAGAGEAQELGFVIASALHYLKALHESGLSLDDARRQISFILAADTDQFLTIAKFRALRLLWTRVEEACGLTALPLRLHGETAWRMMTREDPHVNIMRVGMAVFSAGTGGADVITALPFSMARGLPDAAARRIARNTQLILRAESHVNIVADPAAGSGAIETLTDELCQAGWTQFQAIEAEGGIMAALQAGSLAAAIRDVATRRREDVASRRLPLTGTSEFASLTSVSVACLAPAPESTPESGAFAAHRLAEPYEALRDMARALTPTPEIFLATLGPLADHTARASFAQRVFAAGGIQALQGPPLAREDGTTDLDALSTAVGASRWACLCGSDHAYTAEAAAAITRLKAKGLRLCLAGSPGAHEAAWREAGVELFIFSGCDVVAALKSVLDALAQEVLA